MSHPPVKKLHSLTDEDIISQRVSRRGVLALTTTVGAALSSLLGISATHGQPRHQERKRDNDTSDRPSGFADRDPSDPSGRGRGGMRGLSDADKSDGMGTSDKRREPGGLPSAKPGEPLGKP